MLVYHLWARLQMTRETFEAVLCQNFSKFDRHQTENHCVIVLNINTWQARNARHLRCWVTRLTSVCFRISSVPLSYWSHPCNSWRFEAVCYIYFAVWRNITGFYGEGTIMGPPVLLVAGFVTFLCGHQASKFLHFWHRIVSACAIETSKKSPNIM